MTRIWWEKNLERASPKNQQNLNLYHHLIIVDESCRAAANVTWEELKKLVEESFQDGQVVSRQVGENSWDGDISLRSLASLCLVYFMDVAVSKDDIVFLAKRVGPNCWMHQHLGFYDFTTPENSTKMFKHLWFVHCNSPIMSEEINTSSCSY